HFIAVRDPGSRQLKVWQLAAPKPKLVYRDTDVGQRGEHDFSPDSRRLLYFVGANVRVLTLSNGQVARWQRKGSDFGYLPLRSGFTVSHPEGHLVMFRSWRDGQEPLQVCASDTGVVHARLRHPEHISHHIWNPAGHTIATSCNDHRIRLWNAATWQPSL